MATATMKRKMICKRCKREVVGVTIIKHMWKHHRQHMMKNHTGGKKRVLPDMPPARQLPPHLIRRDGYENKLLTMEQIEALAASRGGPKFKVRLHLGGQHIDISDVTKIEILP